MIPPAFLLDDKVLKKKVTRYVDYLLAHQEGDGWLGPRVMIAAAGQGEMPSCDLGAQLLATKVLVQYHEAAGDERVVDALEKALHCLDARIDQTPLFNWGQFSWFEALIAIYWLYERSGEQWLLDLAVRLHAEGLNWRAFFARWPLTKPTPKGMWSHQYDQQVNQVECSVRWDHAWTTNGGEANIYSLESNYGCCTANLLSAAASHPRLGD